MIWFRRRATRWVGTGLFVALSGVTVWNAWVYFGGADRPAFFAERPGLAAAWWWRALLYWHVVGASVCLVTAAPLMWPGLVRRWPGAHRVIGRVYVVAVLGAAAPAGLCLAPFAKGGWPGRLAFLLLAGLWLGFTLDAVRSAVRGEVARHVRGMVWSYALALSAVSFRVLHAALYGLGVEAETNYVASLWLSLLLSVGWALRCNARGRHRERTRKHWERGVAPEGVLA